MGAEDYRNRKKAINQSIDSTINNLEKGHKEAERVYSVVNSTSNILDELDEEFCRKTQLTAVDTSFMMVAIGLQIARQYLLTKFKDRLDDQTAAKKTPGHNDEHSNRTHRYYKPSLEEIITNPVPFDANIGADGALSGGGILGHRATAIGHDPVLGLIFGTANIATSTLTNSSLESYHITTQNNRDAFFCKARTDLVLSNTASKLLHEGLDGKVKVGTSLVKEVVHLKSDLYTKHSLPLPFVSLYDSRLASELASYGLDMANVVTIGKQMTYTMLINTIIAMIHRVLFDGETNSDRKLYEVRTRKILSYSNLVASSSNIAVAATTQDMKNLDIGGIAVTIYRLITDIKFIRKVKEEFVFCGYLEMVKGNF